MNGKVADAAFRMRADGLGVQTSGMFVDLHCHCLPDVDEEAVSTGAAVALCRRLLQDNITCVIATPHQLGRFEGHACAAAIRETAHALNEQLQRNGIELTVLPGAEVRLDERIERLLAEDEIMTLADRRRHILLELPSDVFIDIRPLLVRLRHAGLEAVLAHPERNEPLVGRPGILQRWLDDGVHLQVTAASLLGRFGSRARSAAWRLVAQGCVSLIATDAHYGSADRLCMTAAFEMIAAHFGVSLARLLCCVNPSRITLGKRLVSATALLRDRQGVW